MAGSSAGSLQQPQEGGATLHPHRGVASDAKIAFFDIGVKEPKRRLKLFTPKNLHETVFSDAYAAGMMVAITYFLHIV